MKKVISIIVTIIIIFSVNVQSFAVTILDKQQNKKVLTEKYKSLTHTMHKLVSIDEVDANSSASIEAEENVVTEPTKRVTTFKLVSLLVLVSFLIVVGIVLKKQNDN